MRRRAKKLAIFALSLFLFILAINLMKEGARDLGPVVRDRFAIDGFANGMGFGWLLSYAIMSGSPVAGSALTFLDAGVIDRHTAYGMVVGSRFGASFIVLFIGFIYTLRGRSRSASLSMGLLSLTVAMSIQLLALPIGLWLLDSGLSERIRWSGEGGLVDLLGALFDPMTAAFGSWLPGWGVFLAGLGIILVSFKLFDLCLPEMTIRESSVGDISHVIYRPWVMFGVGGLVTLVSMSVSVSLGLLVPLSQRGLVRRENVVPYIMGANISTFIDTLVAAMLIANQAALAIVLAEMLSLAIVCVIILITVYRYYERGLLHLVDRMVASRLELGLFMLAIFALPLILVLR